MSNKSRRNSSRRTDPDSPEIQTVPSSPSISLIQKTRVGPIPDAEELQKYGEIQADLPERIMAMAEAQSVHRQTLERLRVEAEIRDRRSERWETRLGQCLGFIIVIAGILGGTYVASTADKWTQMAAGFGISGVTLLGVVHVLVKGKTAREK